MAVGFDDRRPMAWMQVWDVRSNQLVQHYSAHSGPVTNVAFHPSGDFLLSSSLDTTLKVPWLSPPRCAHHTQWCLLYTSDLISDTRDSPRQLPAWLAHQQGGTYTVNGAVI